MIPRRWRLSSPALQGEREAAVKTIARGMPVVPAEPVVTAACYFCCRRAMGAACIRHSLRPLSSRATCDASLGHECAAGMLRCGCNRCAAILRDAASRLLRMRTEQAARCPIPHGEEPRSGVSNHEAPVREAKPLNGAATKMVGFASLAMTKDSCLTIESDAPSRPLRPARSPSPPSASARRRHPASCGNHRS
jgi:hypothetical protein